MTVLYVLVPLALLTAGSAVLAFLWATKNGQLDDLETPALRILHDDTRAVFPSDIKDTKRTQDG
ncbi:MAG TPA: cbb3-type cytochrome oxidase assembly protein CcoS [Polyangiaceae bacterium]